MNTRPSLQHPRPRGAVLAALAAPALAGCFIETVRPDPEPQPTTQRAMFSHVPFALPRLAYWQRRTGQDGKAQFSLHAVDPRTGTQTLVVDGPTSDAFTRASPDGRLLAIADQVTDTLTIVEASSGDTWSVNRAALHLTMGSPVEWSPDSTHIAIMDLVSLMPRRCRLVTARADGTEVRELTPEPFLCNGHLLRWSPTGDEILYFAGSSAETIHAGRLRALNVNTLEQREVFDFRESPPYQVRWTPDGTRVAYPRDGAVIAMDRTGQNPAVLAEAGFDIWDFHWLADGRMEVSGLGGAPETLQRYALFVDGRTTPVIQRQAAVEAGREVAWMDDGVTSVHWDWSWTGGDGQARLLVKNHDDGTTRTLVTLPLAEFGLGLRIWQGGNPLIPTSGF